MFTRSTAKAAPQKIDFFGGEMCVINDTPEDLKKQYYEHGLQMIGEGKVGLLLMAGGQGTRLGSSDPKGMYDIGLSSGKSLFQLQAEQIKRLAVLSAKHCGKDKVNIPWYLITSDATHDKTVAFFKSMKFFGLQEDSVFFAKQGINPCLSSEGKIMMETKSKLAVAPNGNGGLHAALRTSGALTNLNEKGVEYLHCYGVDNVLVKLADPYYIGFSALRECDVSNMVVLKEDPHEKVGVMCLRDGMPGVVEYSEISKEMAEARDADGKLQYSAGNIANHLFKVSFIEEHTSTAKLPLHVAHKKIPTLDEAGNTVTPTANNGIKMEMFVFDVFQMTKKIVLFAVQRETHFSPVKNKPGERGQPFVKDSPDTARRDFSNLCISLVEKAGGTVVKSDDPYDSLEISPLTSYFGEGLPELVKGKTLTIPSVL